MPTEEVPDQSGDLSTMGFQGEVTGVEEVDFGGREISPVGLGADGKEERIVSSPNGEERRRLVAEIGLERRIEVHIGAVVEKQIELDFVSP